MAIHITVKLFAGLDVDAGLDGYNPATGIDIQAAPGVRVKHIVKQLGLPDRRRLAYFIGGTRVGLWKKLRDGDEVACLRPLELIFAPDAVTSVRGMSCSAPNAATNSPNRRV